MGDDGVSVDFDVPREVVRGQLVVGRLEVRNGGDAPRTVSGRLRLGEGDVSLVVVEPSGRERRVLGRYEVDAPPRPVELGPAAALATGLNLHATDAGRLFDQPGIYRLSARYHPSVHDPPVTSAAREVIAQPARAEQDRRLAELLDPAAVGDALAFCDVPPGSGIEQALRAAADLAAGRPDGLLASLVLAASAARRGSAEPLDAVLDALEPELLAWVATAALPPAAEPTDPLVTACLAHVERVNGPAAPRAAAMLRGEPFASGG